MKQLIFLLCLFLLATLALGQSNSFPATGNVGIGTSSPATKFHIVDGSLDYRFSYSSKVPLSMINSSITASGTNPVNVAAFAIGKARTTSNSGVLRYVHSSDGSTANYFGLGFWGNDDILNTTAGGKVGIGVTNPAEKLSVNGNVQVGGLGGRLYYTRSDGLAVGGTGWHTDGIFYASGHPIHGELAGNNVRVYGFGLDLLLGNKPAGDVIAIKPTGSVGIGTNAPGTYKLAVEGTIGARKVKVTQSSWADYVFEPAYKLLPLSEVAKYIQENRHLPEVPSALEVEQNGLDIGDNQATLLKKIEELTLYAIDADKRLNNQQQIICALQKAVKELQAINMANAKK